MAQKKKSLCLEELEEIWRVALNIADWAVQNGLCDALSSLDDLMKIPDIVDTAVSECDIVLPEDEYTRLDIMEKAAVTLVEQLDVRSTQRIFIYEDEIKRHYAKLKEE